MKRVFDLVCMKFGIGWTIWRSYKKPYRYRCPWRCPRCGGLHYEIRGRYRWRDMTMQYQCYDCFFRWLVQTIRADRVAEKQIDKAMSQIRDTRV